MLSLAQSPSSIFDLCRRAIGLRRRGLGLSPRDFDRSPPLVIARNVFHIRSLAVRGARVSKGRADMT